MDRDQETFEMLKEKLGEEAAMTLVKEWGGSALYIPKTVLLKERYQAIRREFADGASYHALAMRYGYSVSHIRYIVHKTREDG